MRLSRRRLLTSSAALGASMLLAPRSGRASDPEPEIRHLRLIEGPVDCLGPQYLAAELLAAEGFEQIDSVPSWTEGWMNTLSRDGADFAMDTVTDVIPAVDRGENVVVVAGIHGGCYELMGHESVRAIHDLKGKRVAIIGPYVGDHVLISSMASYVGLKPERDIHWITTPSFDEPVAKFVAREVDAFIGFPPQPQKLRAMRVGHTVVDTKKDRPWSNYYCCVLSANRHFVKAYPHATRRVVRAYLKAADLCADDPARVARFMVSRGFDEDYDRVLEVVRGSSYRRWRSIDVEDTFRFHLVRLHEAGMLRMPLKDLIDRALDLRFFRELRRELKA